MASEDKVEAVLAENKDFLRIHCMNAYKSYVHSGGKRGLYMVFYRSVEDAIHDSDFTYAYATSESDWSKMEMRCSLPLVEICTLYDPCVQTVLLIVIEGQPAVECAFYSEDDTRNWMQHIDCHIPAGQED